jgi:hypothetical protein
MTSEIVIGYLLDYLDSVVVKDDINVEWTGIIP